MRGASHADEARRVNVVATCDGRTLRLRVSDDGRGLDGTPSGGFGLLGMRERATLAGGDVLVEATDPGTTVTLTLPVVRQVAAPG